MIFQDRTQAGSKLAEKLKPYQNSPDAIIIGLPRGGVVVAYQIAQELNLPLDIIVTRKIGAPGFEELAIGAITEEGKAVLDYKIIKTMEVEGDYIKSEIEKEKKEAQRRLKTYRGNRPPLDLKNKIAIIVDDGIATGATIKAAIKSATGKGAKQVIVAVPVAPRDVIDSLKKETYKIICLEKPPTFYGISMFYKEFAQTEDKEVIQLMEKVYEKQKNLRYKN